MATGTKRKRDTSLPIITYHAPNKTFDRLFKEESLSEMKAVIQKKLGLSSETSIELSQIREEKIVSLEDEDDFDAFFSVAHSATAINVKVTLGAKAVTAQESTEAAPKPRKKKLKASDVSSNAAAPPKPANKKRKISFAQSGEGGTAGDVDLNRIEVEREERSTTTNTTSLGEGALPAGPVIPSALAVHVAETSSASTIRNDPSDSTKTPTSSSADNADVVAKAVPEKPKILTSKGTKSGKDKSTSIVSGKAKRKSIGDAEGEAGQKTVENMSTDPVSVSVKAKPKAKSAANASKSSDATTGTETTNNETDTIETVKKPISKTPKSTVKKKAATTTTIPSAIQDSGAATATTGTSNELPVTFAEQLAAVIANVSAPGIPNSTNVVEEGTEEQAPSAKVKAKKSTPKDQSETKEKSGTRDTPPPKVKSSAKEKHAATKTPADKGELPANEKKSSIKEKPAVEGKPAPKDKSSTKSKLSVNDNPAVKDSTANEEKSVSEDQAISTAKVSSGDKLTAKEKTKKKANAKPKGKLAESDKKSQTSAPSKVVSDNSTTGGPIGSTMTGVMKTTKQITALSKKRENDGDSSSSSENELPLMTSSIFSIPQNNNPNNPLDNYDLDALMRGPEISVADIRTPESSEEERSSFEEDEEEEKKEVKRKQRKNRSFYGPVSSDEGVDDEDDIEDATDEVDFDPLAQSGSPIDNYLDEQSSVASKDIGQPMTFDEVARLGSSTEMDTAGDIAVADASAADNAVFELMDTEMVDLNETVNSPPVDIHAQTSVPKRKPVFTIPQPNSRRNPVVPGTRLLWTKDGRNDSIEPPESLSSPLPNLVDPTEESSRASILPRQSTPKPEMINRMKARITRYPRDLHEPMSPASNGINATASTQHSPPNARRTRAMKRASLTPLSASQNTETVLVPSSQPVDVDEGQPVAVRRKGSPGKAVSQKTVPLAQTETLAAMILEEDSTATQEAFSQSSQAGNISLTQWEILPQETQIAMVDELQSGMSSPPPRLQRRTRKNTTNSTKPTSFAKPSSQESLKVPPSIQSQSQITSPYSQFDTNAHVESQRNHASSDDSEDEEEVEASIVKTQPDTASQKPSLLYRRLTDIAGQTTLFQKPPPLRPAVFSEVKDVIADLYGNTANHNDSSEDSSGNSDSEPKQLSHIPRARRAGVNGQKK